MPAAPQLNLGGKANFCRQQQVCCCLAHICDLPTRSGGAQKCPLHWKIAVAQTWECQPHQPGMPYALTIKHTSFKAAVSYKHNVNGEACASAGFTLCTWQHMTQPETHLMTSSVRVQLNASQGQNKLLHFMPVTQHRESSQHKKSIKHVQSSTWQQACNITVVTPAPRCKLAQNTGLETVCCDCIPLA